MLLLTVIVLPFELIMSTLIQLHDEHVQDTLSLLPRRYHKVAQYEGYIAVIPQPMNLTEIKDLLPFT